MTEATAAQEPGHEPSDASDPPASPDAVTMEFLAQRMNALFTQQETLIRVVNRNSEHVLKLHQTIDPLTWKSRAALLFGGAFTGGGTAAFLAHMFLHAALGAPPTPQLPLRPAVSITP
jgi:hypothetical protein